MYLLRHLPEYGNFRRAHIPPVKSGYRREGDTGIPYSVLEDNDSPRGRLELVAETVEDVWRVC